MAGSRTLLFPGAALWALACRAAVPAEGDATMLTDFGPATPDLGWRTVNDNVMGGRSQGGFRIESGVLVFSGSTNTDGGGFSSIRSTPRELGLDAARGVSLRVRGDGRTYTFRLQAKGTRAAYWAEFATRSGGEWQVVRIPFSRFRPRWRGQLLEGPALDRSAIEGVGLMIYDKRDGPFLLEVDWIRGYETVPAFSMDRFAWKYRPLLIFAPDGEDARLERQLEQVARSREGFRERDMVLVVVLEKGASRAGEFPLDATEAAALRERYGVGSGEFALRLVGKDGGVKREAGEPVAITKLFEQIDRMPMRRAERD